MALAYDDREKIKAHLAKFWKKNLDCPICGQRKWNIENIISPRTMQHEENAIRDHLQIQNIPNLLPEVSVEVVPIVIVMCRNCYYIRHFGWVPIEHGT